MAGDQDDAQKTEDPSQKKLEDAQKKGDVARSQEIKHWFMLVGAAIIVSSMAPWVAEGIKGELGGFLAGVHNVPMDGESLVTVLTGVISEIGLWLFAPIIILIAAGFGGNVVQHKVAFSTEKIKPKLSKLSLIAGFKRMFSAQSFVEFAKTIAKLVIVAGVSLAIIWPERGVLVSIISSQPQQVAEVVWIMAIKLLIGVVSVMTVIAGLDFAFQKMQHTKKLRMTKQEVKDEHKQLEGDPHVKARIRQLRQDRARVRMMSNVPDAAVIVTNPTHYAVALKYEHGKTEVPIVLAKGVDLIAAKIREIAEEHDIPFVENPPLARALYATVEIDDEVPSDHYKAVAEVISFVLRLRKRGGRRPRQRM